MSWIEVEENIAQIYSAIDGFSHWEVNGDQEVAVHFDAKNDQKIVLLKADFEVVDTRINIGAMAGKPEHTRLWHIFGEARSSDQRPHIKEHNRCQAAAARQVQSYFGALIK